MVIIDFFFLMRMTSFMDEVDILVHYKSGYKEKVEIIRAGYTN